MPKGPVVVTVNCEASPGYSTVEVDRSEWERMSPGDRLSLVSEMADEHVNMCGGYGWHIEDEGDLASVATEPEGAILQSIEKMLPDMDLEAVTRAVARRIIRQAMEERIIRQAMEETGESREILAEMFDSMASMDQEAVLSLTEGEPTTLRNALERYVDGLAEQALPGVDREEGPVSPEAERTRIHDELSAILAFPFPGGES